MKASRPADEDRLPWLEPYRESIAQKQRVARRSHGGLVAYAAALVLMIAAAGAGYWYGQRGDAPRPVPSDTIAVPPARPQPVEVAQAPPVTAPEPAAEEPAPELAKVTKPAATKKKVARRKPPPRRKIRSAGTQQARLDAVRAAQEREARARAWPKMPSPGPAGQVIQLGAFTTPVRAASAYQQRVARYKALAGMPRVIVPVVTKPDGRILYVLRLGTTSRQHSKTVCRNLRASGDHCLVIG